MTPLTKKQKPKTNKFFSLQTCQVFWGFEQLSSTIDWPVMELQSGMKIATHAGFLGMLYSYTSSKHVKHHTPIMVQHFSQITLAKNTH